MTYLWVATSYNVIKLFYFTLMSNIKFCPETEHVLFCRFRDKTVINYEEIWTELNDIKQCCSEPSIYRMFYLFYRVPVLNLELPIRFELHNLKKMWVKYSTKYCSME